LSAPRTAAAAEKCRRWGVAVVALAGSIGDAEEACAGLQRRAFTRCRAAGHGAPGPPAAVAVAREHASRVCGILETDCPSLPVELECR
jgi:hypothetical protein